MRVGLAAMTLLAAMTWGFSITGSFPSPDSDIRGLAWMDGTLYAADASSGIVFALDPDDGSILDSWETGFNVSATSLGSTSDTLFVGFANGYVRGYSDVGLVLAQASLVC